MRKSTGSIALLGGGEWTEPCRALDSHLLHLADCDEVLIVPTAAAFEHPDRSVEQAVAWFAGLGATATGLPVLNRRDAVLTAPPAAACADPRGAVEQAAHRLARSGATAPDLRDANRRDVLDP